MTLRIRVNSKHIQQRLRKQHRIMVLKLNGRYLHRWFQMSHLNSTSSIRVRSNQCHKRPYRLHNMASNNRHMRHHLLLLSYNTHMLYNNLHLQHSRHHLAISLGKMLSRQRLHMAIQMTAYGTTTSKIHKLYAEASNVSE